MYCSELDRLLTEHSALTMELFRQEGRTGRCYRTVEEWERECRKLHAIERQLARLTLDVAAHRRRHSCCGAAVLATEDTEVADETTAPAVQPSA